VDWDHRGDRGGSSRVRPGAWRRFFGRPCENIHKVA